MLQDNEFFKWLLGGIGSLGGALFGYHKYIDGKMSKKADKERVNEEFAEVRSELLMQRGNVAKLFDQIRENEQRAQDRHERVMERLLK